MKFGKKGKDLAPPPAAGGGAPRSADDTARGRLADAAGALLSLVVVLRETSGLDALSDVRGSVEKLFGEFRSRARDRGAVAADIEDASYALAATIDETLLNANWEGRAGWQTAALAKTYCNDEFVGLGFFDKLAQVRRSGGDRRDVIEVFYYCLACGFQGKYVEEPARIADLLDELSKEISTPVKGLSPRGYPEREGGRLEPIRTFPWPTVVALSIAVPVIVWGICSILLDRHAEKVVRALTGGS